MNILTKSNRDLVEVCGLHETAVIVHAARKMLYSNVHLDESQWPQLHEDAREMNKLMAELDSYGHYYTARLVVEDGSFYVELINSDADSEHYDNLCASCWLDEHGLFYYEA